MADVKWEDLSAEQGFNFARDVNTPIGHLVNLAIGDKTNIIPQNTKVVIPPNSDTNAQYGVVGVLTSFVWDGGAAGHWNVKALVAKPQFQAIKNLLHRSLKSTALFLTVRIWTFDSTATPDPCWICSLCSVNDSANTAALANNAFQFQTQIRKEDKTLKFTIADAQNGTVQQPACHELDFTCTPMPVVNDCTLQFSQGNNFVKQWGIPLTS